jgi:integrase
MDSISSAPVAHVPWNKGKRTGQKPPLKLREIWAIRIRLQLASVPRDLAMFNLAIACKLRACDLTKLRVRDVCHGERVAPRATVLQQKTQRPVQFEITEQTRESVALWIREAKLGVGDYVFPSRIHDSPQISTRQYSRLVHRWIGSMGWTTRRMARTRCAARKRR